MSQKLFWFALISVVLSGQTCFGYPNSSGEENQVCKNDLLRFEVDQLKISNNKISEELAQVKDAALETSKTMLEKQNKLIEQLLSSVLNSQPKDTSLETSKLEQMMEKVLFTLSVIASGTSQTEISEELAKIKETVDKQSSMLEQVLKDSVTVASNISTVDSAKIPKEEGDKKDEKIQQAEEDDDYLKSCKSAEFSGTFELKCEKCQSPATVYCEMESFDGGWTVIQQRIDGFVNFYRNWQDYRNGFGTVGGENEFWLGLELIHQITNSADYELAIELKDENGKYGYARYSDFKIAGEDEKYRLSLGEFSGTIDDALSDQNGGKFSTYDQDNDLRDGTNCSEDFFGGCGWWYRYCGSSGLNAPYTKGRFGSGLRWDDFTEAASYSRMMIRRK